MRQALLFAVAVSALSACATEPIVVFDKPDGSLTQKQFQHDRDECLYQAELALATYGSSYRPQSLGEAIGAGIGHGIAVNDKTRRLIRLCMRVKGYVEVGVVDEAGRPITSNWEQEGREPGRW